MAIHDATWLVFVQYTMRHAVHVVSPVEFEGGEHAYWIHPTNVQLLTDPVIMSAKEEHGCDSGSESLVLLD
jgi:hypothetical protein